MNTTTEKTYKQKKTALEQKLELAKELGLEKQVLLIQKEMKINEIEQKNTYEEVTKEQARNAMCPKKEIQFERKMTGKWWKKDWDECKFQTGSALSTFITGRSNCDRTDTHQHAQQKALKIEVLGLEQNDDVTPLPMAALIRMKDAKAKNVFDSFQVWRPETDAEQKNRLEDPWLVGVVANRFFKLCDWR